MDYSQLPTEIDERGLLIINSFFSAAKTDEIEAEVRRYIEKIGEADAQSLKGHVVFEAGEERKIRNIFHIHKAAPYFDELARSSTFVDLFRALFNDEPVLMSVELFGKPARVGSEVPYHQDNAYFNLVPADAITIWVALAEATESNGCVRYIEGSHKYGNLPHHASGVKGNSMRLTDLPKDAGAEICGTVPRGGALIHHCNTIHRSERNDSANDRPGLLFVYKAARCEIDHERVAKYQQALALSNA